MSNRVYTVESGDYCQGGSVLGVFATQQLAVSEAVRIMAASAASDDWKLTGTFQWDNGADWLWVVTRDVVGEQDR